MFDDIPATTKEKWEDKAVSQREEGNDEMDNFDNENASSKGSGKLFKGGKRRHAHRARGKTRKAMGKSMRQPGFIEGMEG